MRPDSRVHAGRLVTLALAALLALGSCSFSVATRRTESRGDPPTPVATCSPVPMVADIVGGGASLGLALAADELATLAMWISTGIFAASAIHGVDEYHSCEEEIETAALADSMPPPSRDAQQDSRAGRTPKPRALGSCFAVAREGYLVTNQHVVRGAKRVEVAFTDGERLPAEVAQSDRENDIAILKIEGHPPAWLHVGPSTERSIGDRVFTVGYPLARDLGVDPKFNEGAISSLSVGSQPMMIQVQIPVHPGNSGGPLVTEKGVVVGVVRARPHDAKFLSRSGAIAQEISWAVRSEVILRMLDDVKLPPKMNLNRSEAIALTTAASCMVAAYSD